MPDLGSTRVRASFEPRHGETPQSWHLVRKPGRYRPAGGYGAKPRGTSRRYDRSEKGIDAGHVGGIASGTSWTPFQMVRVYDAA